METEARKLPKRRLLHQEVSRYIRQAILLGELKPGDRIVETKLAQLLGVSQAPVREAIRELEFSGLVEQKPYLGTYVKQITMQDMQNFYRVRGALEKLGAQQACKNITVVQLDEIEKVMQEMERAGAQADNERYVQMDALFHDKIIAASGNDLLCKLWEQCNIKSWLFVGTALARRDIAYLASRHRRIFERLRERDTQGLEEAVQDHLEQLLSMMLETTDKTKGEF